MKYCLALACLLPFAVACGDNLEGTAGLGNVDPDASAQVDANLGADATQAPDAHAPPDATIALDAPVTPGLPDATISLACSIEDLTPLFTCAQASCSTDLTLTCVLTHCGLLVFGLPPACQQCVLGAATGDLTSALGACVGGLPMP